MICWRLATWFADRQDYFRDREAIMAIDARHPYVPPIREAFKDVVRVAERMGSE
ncbi:MAG: hypothetical protein V3T53_02470 [Phycisphaerales bacterium]